MILDLYPTKYDGFLQPIVECLRYSPLVITLTMYEIIPMVLMSKAYSTASYQKEEQRITFEIFNKKTDITKSHFCSMLGLPQKGDLIDPKSISNFAIMDMLFQMGYKEVLFAVSMFKNPNLPPIWNRMLTLLFKSFFECVT